MDSFVLGDLAVARIEEAVEPLAPPEVLLPSVDRAQIERHVDWLAPNYYTPETGTFTIVVQSWLIRTGGLTILVDTCGGNCKPRPWFPFFDQASYPYLENMQAAGITPEEIDIVFCTHLHLDHCGWNTRLEDGRWVPTFPNARYLFSREEYASWHLADGEQAPHYVVFEDSVRPIIDAGLAQMIDPVHVVAEGIRIEAASGHSPGHCILRATSRGESALFTGDALHHPLQIAHPELYSGFCADPLAANVTRRRILEDCADHGHLLVPAHFGAPHAGRIERAGDAFRFLPGL
jgi:glyoxylase-like metal-dependent hydrolase (beta-lactamase superfamily II)